MDPSDTALPLFVICTERGLLERKSILLVESLRAFGGSLSRSPVVSYAPRTGRGPGDRARALLVQLGVALVDDELNRDHADYAFANKIVASEHAAATLGADRDGPVVFLDSDMLVAAPPTGLADPGRDGVVLRPVERRIGGSSGSDEHADYWRRILVWAGVDTPLWVRTSMTGEAILGYWNAGMVAASPGSGFFGAWRALFEGLVDEGLIHPMGMTFMDQIALALAVHRTGRDPVDPGPGYNRPVSVGRGAPASPGPEPAHSVLVHYHHALDHAPLRDPLAPHLPQPVRAEAGRLVRTAGLAGPAAYLRRRLLPGAGR